MNNRQNKYNPILQEVTQRTNDYLWHLIAALKDALYFAQPDWNPYGKPSYKVYREFYGCFAKKMLTDNPLLFAKLNIDVTRAQRIIIEKGIYWNEYNGGEKDIFLAIGETLYRNITEEMEECLTNSQKQYNLFKQFNTHPLILTLPYLAKYCTLKYNNPNIENVLKKLTTVADLKKILIVHESQDSNDIVTTLRKFKDTLNKEHSLAKPLHLRWDIFFTTVSIILFPIAVLRIGYNLKVNGTWHIMWSDGKKFKERVNKIIPADDSLEKKSLGKHHSDDENISGVTLGRLY